MFFHPKESQYETGLAVSKEKMLEYVDRWMDGQTNAGVIGIP